MNQIVLGIGKALIGKNLPSLMRAASTFIGGLLLATVVFSPDGAPIDPDLASGATAIETPSAAEIEDGVTIGEVANTIAGLLLIWITRVFSWLRARNLDWLAKLAGPFIGRSLPSLVRALLTMTAGGLAYLTAQPEQAPEVIADMPLATGLGAVASFVLARIFSAVEDGKRNPVRPRLDPGSLDV